MNLKDFEAYAYWKLQRQADDDDDEIDGDDSLNEGMKLFGAFIKDEYMMSELFKERERGER